MNYDHFRRLPRGAKYDRLIDFIRALRMSKIPYSHIDTNGWRDSMKPRVYVHNKHNRFILRGYSRCSTGDLNSAVKFYNSRHPRGVR